MIERHIAISGELGSGKSAVAGRLAEAYGCRLVSTGDIQRSLAESLNLSTLETNLLAEQDQMIDSQVDGVTRDLGDSPDPIVFDSRMAWKMVPSAYKVYLLVNAEVAAVRLHSRNSTPVEVYSSSDEALVEAEKRYQSERRRFLATYGVDVSRLANYDLVIDTSDASIGDVVAAIQAAMAGGRSQGWLKISPRRILRQGRDLVVDGTFGRPSVVYLRPYFAALSGQDILDDGVQRGAPFVDVELVAEGQAEIVGGVTVEQYIHDLRSDTVQDSVADTLM